MEKNEGTWLPKSGIEAIAADVLAGYEEMIGAPVAPPIPVEDVIIRFPLHTIIYPLIPAFLNTQFNFSAIGPSKY
jgi:hypothetical protein